MSASDILILSLFDMVMMISVAGALSKRTTYKPLRTFVYVVIGAGIIALGALLFEEGVIVHVYSTLVNSIWLYIYLKPKGIGNYIITYILATIILTVYQIASAVAVQALMPGFDRTLFYGFIAQSLGLIIAIVVWKLGTLIKLNAFITKGNTVFKAIVINLYLVYYFLTIAWYLELDSIIQARMELIVVIMISLLINVMFFRGSIVDRANEEKIELLETYLPVIDDVMAEFKAKQHDYHNHVQTMISMRDNPSLLQEGKMDEYIDKLISKDVWHSLIYMKNKVVMAFLYSKYAQAEEQGINIHYDVTNNEMPTNFTDYELVEMFGILIDNAIEAAMKTDEKIVDVEIAYENDQNLLHIANSTLPMKTAEVTKMFENGYSTKEEPGHGIGLTKIQKMIDKEKGTITNRYDTSANMLHISLHYK